ncbi:MAG: hypothetical protein NTY07_17070 [Bacteroidia bacterium]|nr:hypothetical protein [Bacteroidia bacterium]
MNYILFFLILLLALAIVLGLIKPSIVIFRGAKTRKKVITVYGLAILLAFVLFAITIDDKGSKSKNKENDTLKNEAVAVAPFASVIYDVSCTGSNKESVDLFKTFSPVTISIYYSNDKFRMIEKEGTAGNIIADFSNKQVFFLDSLTKTATKATCTDMEAAMKDENMRKLMPTHYRAILEETPETLNICGFKCKKFKLVKSGFVKAYATAVVWITNDIILKQIRFDFQTKNRRILTPLPLQVGIDGGTILKMEVNENNVIATYTAISISTNKPAYNLFELPEKYQIKEE